MTSHTTSALRNPLLRGLAAVLIAGTAATQVQTPPYTHLPHTLDSGAVANPSAREEVVISFTVEHPGATWMRLYFERVDLAGDVLAGTGARLRVTSHLDGDVLEMNALHLQQWQNSTTYFNGDALQVEVVAPPHAGPSRVVMRGLDAGFAPVDDPTICGPTDDRALSSDSRSARLLPIGCTGWLIDDCAKCFLTAGHCTGSLSVVEFNVPLSDSGGGLNHPPASDQYAVDPASLQTNGGQGVGNDWGYFGCFANPVTGLTPYEAQAAAFSLSLPPGSTSGNEIRITGYGTDSTPLQHNQVQQTHVGPLWVTTPTAEVGYRTDTTGGNSGSPVIWEQTGLAVGIHTHGGCDSSGGNNWGTSVGNAGLQAVLAAPKGICSAGFTHPAGLPTVLAPGQATPVEVELLSATATNVNLNYRYDGGTFTPIPMTFVGGQTWTADLPPADCDDDPEFFFSADDPTCGTVTSPPGAPSDVFTALVGVLTTIFADDFESDQGWTTEVLGAQTGDWQRGIPVNDPNWSYDPIADADGSGRCYLTQNQTGNTDVDDGSVRLTSPTFDLSSGGMITYSYYLYLTDESGIDRLLVEANSAGGAGSWLEVARHDTSGALDWRTFTILDTDLVAAGLTLTSNMQVRFTANDSDPQSINEAGLDAFQVVQLTCSSTQIGSSYCGPAVQNSSGQSAVIAAYGSDAVVDNDVTLMATQLPTNEFGYFVNSQTQDFVVGPGGSQGNLCLGGTTGRHMSTLGSTGAAGELSAVLDLTQIPTATGPYAVQPGETWNFQCWFRDHNPGSTSNFTDGVEILFQ